MTTPKKALLPCASPGVCTGPDATAGPTCGPCYREREVRELAAEVQALREELSGKTGELDALQSRLEAAEARVKNAESEAVLVRAVLDAVVCVLNGESVSDFESSFPEVQLAVSRILERDHYMERMESYRATAAKLAEALEAMLGSLGLRAWSSAESQGAQNVLRDYREGR